MTIGLLFPGQGSQKVGMGREVYEQSPAARAIFAEANAVLGFDLAGLCFDGPEADLTATENTQPALLTVSVALLAAIAEAGVDLHPSIVAGHSLGEYSALVAAKALDFATALRLVRQRGELMAQASEGAMAAVIGLDLGPLEAICANVSKLGACVVANQNAHGQLVISGASAAVAAASEQAKAAGAKKIMPLNVSAAFHSPLMAATAAGLAPAIAAAAMSAAHVPLIANSTAQPIQRAEDLRAELIAQITAPVRWIATIEQAAAMGVQIVIEIGAGSVLTGLVKRIDPNLQRLNIANFDDIAKIAEYNNAQ
ncbi:MAG TPA: [acyl-carrier-protein] S-malonyltransferase [Herpetosiphon sp.]|uniref:Malonyl CoA-acyl carrier protein transacylase n=1 Tax=Herpetosiphon aurantiacus (strain ATCC 23779 / DSM 785 / 114-95) TaxID=316274 RepID=A9AXH9_HERA2|nr:ACP S-malonyltransferase [Herpetosiphon sp.]ABX03393.1 malonyl CoA-acyl carrier protein transacylase [Herpetosiphon aurantiacus DSM 785]HBW48785.1 [acyl-carrier-protein] S-malonyltransferase [Herpetosiphon sp.]